MDIDRIIEIVRTLKEQPTMSVAGGGIAGIQPGETPPVYKKKKKKGEPTILARGLMPGARKRWMK